MCNDNLNALVIEGNAPEEALKAAKSSLVIEFSELSGNPQMLSINNSLKKIYLHRLRMQILQDCAVLISYESMEVPQKELRRFNITISNPEKTIKTIEGKIKEEAIRLNQALSKYNDSAQDAGERPTIQFFNEQLALLSSFFKFDITMDISLAKYAAYLKLYTQQNTVKDGKL